MYFFLGFQVNFTAYYLKIGIIQDTLVSLYHILNQQEKQNGGSHANCKNTLLL